MWKRLSVERQPMNGQSTKSRGHQYLLSTLQYTRVIFKKNPARLVLCLSLSRPNPARLEWPLSLVSGSKIKPRARVLIFIFRVLTVWGGGVGGLGWCGGDISDEMSAKGLLGDSWRSKLPSGPMIDLEGLGQVSAATAPRVQCRWGIEHWSQ